MGVHARVDDELVIDRSVPVVPENTVTKIVVVWKLTTISPR